MTKKTNGDIFEDWLSAPAPAPRRKVDRDAINAAKAKEGQAQPSEPLPDDARAYLENSNAQRHKKWADTGSRADPLKPRKGERKSHVRKAQPDSAPLEVRRPLPFAFVAQCAALLSVVCVAVAALLSGISWLQSDGAPELSALLNPTPCPTRTPTLTPIPTATATPTLLPTLTASSTATLWPTSTPTLTATPTATEAQAVIVPIRAPRAGGTSAGGNGPDPLVVVSGIALAAVGVFVVWSLRAGQDEVIEAEPLVEPVVFTEAETTGELLKLWRAWLYHFVRAWFSLDCRGRDAFTRMTQLEGGHKLPRKAWETTMMYLQRAGVVEVESAGARMLCTMTEAREILAGFVPAPFPEVAPPGKLFRAQKAEPVRDTPCAMFTMGVDGRLEFKGRADLREGENELR